MCRAVVLVLVGVLFVGACSGGEDGAADTSAASTPDGAGEPIVIRTRVFIADEPGAEPIATGEVLEGSTHGDRRTAADLGRRMWGEGEDAPALSVRLRNQVRGSVAASSFTFKLDARRIVK